MTHTAGAPLSLPPNFSIAAAQAQGMIPSNVRVVSISGKTLSAPATISALIAIGALDPSLPASALGFAAGPQYSGD